MLLILLQLTTFDKIRRIKLFPLQDTSMRKGEILPTVCSTNFASFFLLAYCTQEMYITYLDYYTSFFSI